MAFYGSLDDIRERIGVVFESEMMMRLYRGTKDEARCKAVRPVFEQVVDQVARGGSEIRLSSIEWVDVSQAFKALTWLASDACPSLQLKAAVCDSDREPIADVPIQDLPALMDGEAREYEGVQASTKNVAIWFKVNDWFAGLVVEDR